MHNYNLDLLKSLSTKQITVINCLFSWGETIKDEFTSEFILYDFNAEKIHSYFKKNPHLFFKRLQAKSIFINITDIPSFIKNFEKYSDNLYQYGSIIILNEGKFNSTDSRIGIIQHPCFLAEIKNYPADLAQLFINKTKTKNAKLKNSIFKRINTIRNIYHLEQFELFLKEFIFHLGKPINFKSVSDKIGLSQPTVEFWFDLLVEIGVLFKLNPLAQNYSKRLIKSPKYYFTDISLFFSLCKIKDIEELHQKWDYFIIYEHMIISILFHHFNYKGIENQNINYWRESNGHEVKIITTHQQSLDIYEVTSNPFFELSQKKELDFFDYISEGKVLSKRIIHNGFITKQIEDCTFVSIRKLDLM